jgi:hypothetical protein
MPIEVTCNRCGQRSAAPDQMAGQQARCSTCSTILTIPAPHRSFDDGTSGYGLAMLPAEQWFITLLDGRQLPPATQAQFDAAVARGAIPQGAYVRRGDWEHGVPFSSYIAQRQAEAHAAAQRQQAAHKAAANPYGTGMQQFASNPVGTLLFGPKMPKYQANRAPDVRAHRWRIFLRWVYGLLGLAGAAIILPMLSGILRFDPRVIVTAPLVGLVMSFWPGVFYLIGMFMFAGAHFEWSWFMNSRRMRAMRSGGGDAMARGFYLWTGGIAMGLAGAASIVLTLVVTGTMFFMDMDELAEKQAGAGADPSIGAVAQAEIALDMARNRLDVTLFNLEQALIRYADREEYFATHADHEFVRKQRQAAIDSIRDYRAKLPAERENWRQALADLEKALAAEGNPHSDVLQRERRKPPAGDPPLAAVEREGANADPVALAVPAPIVATQQTSPASTTAAPASTTERTPGNPFPWEEIKSLENKINQDDQQLHAFMARYDQSGLECDSPVADPGPPVRILTAREHLRSLAKNIDRDRSRLQDYERRLGYQSQLLKQRSAHDRIERYIAARAIDIGRPLTPLTPEVQLRLGELAGRKLLELQKQKSDSISQVLSARLTQGPRVIGPGTADPTDSAGDKLRRLEAEAAELEALETYWKNVQRRAAGRS